MGTEEHEINRKRKIDNQAYQISRNVEDKKNGFLILSKDDEENNNDLLTLSLSNYRPSIKSAQLSPENRHHLPSSLPPAHLSMGDESLQPHISLSILPPPPPPPSVSPSVPCRYRQPASSVSSSRVRRNPSQLPREGKNATVPAPFPWATNQRATVHSLNNLLTKHIYTIFGDVQCKKCEQKYQMEYDLQRKFFEVGKFIAENKDKMHDRAPGVWINPNLPACRFCKQENCVKPIISEKKKSINWLFLLLGQMLGCCTLEQLKYFCKHTRNHRTGAKDRVLYLTYLSLCKQLDPYGPFDR